VNKFASLFLAPKPNTYLPIMEIASNHVGNAGTDLLMVILSNNWVFVGVTCVCLIVIGVFMVVPMNCCRKRKVALPTPPTGADGTHGDAIEQAGGLMHYAKQLHASMGDVVGVTLRTGQRIVCLASPQDIEKLTHIGVRPDHFFAFTRLFLSPLNLQLMNADQSRLTRKDLMPTFGPRNIAGAFRPMQALAESIVTEWIKSTEGGKPVLVQHALLSYALRAISLVMGAPPGFFDVERFLEAYNKFCVAVFFLSERLKQVDLTSECSVWPPAIRVQQGEKLSPDEQARHTAALAYWDTLFEQLLQYGERRDSGDDLLAHVLQAPDPLTGQRYTRVAAKSHLTIFFVAVCSLVDVTDGSRIADRSDG
jgi:cytochrome P450